VRYLLKNSKECKTLTDCHGNNGNNIDDKAVLRSFVVLCSQNEKCMEVVITKIKANYEITIPLPIRLCISILQYSCLAVRHLSLFSS